MFPYQAYQLVHLVGIMCTFAGLGGLALHAAAGGSRDASVRRPAIVLHGLGLFLVLLGGFGMLARIGDSVLAPWVMGKLVIWLALGGLAVLPYRGPGAARGTLALAPLLGLAAASLALFHS